MMPSKTPVILADPMPYQIDIEIASSSPHIPLPGDMEYWINAALTQAVADPDEDLEISIYVVDEAESQALNQQYRQQNKATNVLSFPAEIPAELGVPLLGDLVICAPVVAREAEEQHKALAAHWAHMLVHGTLHLLGYDHIDDADAEQMESLETLILQALNFPPPYETGQV